MSIILEVFALYLFKELIIIINTRKEDISKDINSTLIELKWQYDREWQLNEKWQCDKKWSWDTNVANIQVESPQMEMKVWMAKPNCSIWFRKIKDKENIKRFYQVLRNKMSRNVAKPYLPAGLFFLIFGNFYLFLTLILFLQSL